ncbi:hypothetical protein [Sphingomonas faeni]|uniref:hypothetical protein n=1 Tax=Sphingomonas faeni TaxID=185950 RepID=UPI00334FEC3F
MAGQAVSCPAAQAVTDVRQIADQASLNRSVVPAERAEEYRAHDAATPNIEKWTIPMHIVPTRHRFASDISVSHSSAIRMRGASGS